jgi:hypothetical protein
MKQYYFECQDMVGFGVWYVSKDGWTKNLKDTLFKSTPKEIAEIAYKHETPSDCACGYGLIKEAIL